MISLFIYLASFIALWFGAGLIIRSVDKFSKTLKISAFATSFFILGMLTSIPELSVGLTSIANKDPEIFVGNLLGGVIIIFLLIIPLLAILGNGIKLAHQLDKGPLIISLLVIGAPSFFIADKNISTQDGILMILLYVFMSFFIQKNQGVLEAFQKQVKKKKINYLQNLIYIILGVIIVYFSSNSIVNNTLYFSGLLGVSPFFISLLVLSLGTNLPELSLAIRSVLSGKKEVAFGDYIGSAAANTLLFGFLSLMYKGTVNINGNFYITFLFIAVGLSLFYYFAQSKNTISRKEGFMLFCVYIIFVGIELFRSHFI